MRMFLAAALLLSVSAPALAGQRDRNADAIADRLNDRSTHAAIGGAMQAMTTAMLDLRIDGIARALEPFEDPLDRDREGYRARTMRDLVARDDPHFEDRIADESARAAATMGAAAGAVADLVPQLHGMADQMQRSIDHSLRRLPPRY